MVGVAGLLATAAAAVATDRRVISPDKLTQGALITMAACLLILLALLLFSFVVVVVRERSETKKTLQLLRVEEGFRAAVPSLLRFERRSDRLVLEPDGTGTLHWLFELTSPPEESISRLFLPIFVEVPQSRADAACVEVGACKVNHSPATATYVDVERRVPVASVDATPAGGVDGTSSAANALEYGVLSVPARLQDVGRSEIETTVTFRGVWAKATTNEDVFFVDVPYLTENFELVIEGSDGCTPHLPHDNNPAINASSLAMDIPDANEGVRQSEKIRELDDGRIRWRPNALKLGYRYRVRFRLETTTKQPEKGEGRAATTSEA